MEDCVYSHGCIPRFQVGDFNIDFIFIGVWTSYCLQPKLPHNIADIVPAFGAFY